MRGLPMTQTCYLGLCSALTVDGQQVKPCSGQFCSCLCHREQEQHDNGELAAETGQSVLEKINTDLTAAGDGITTSPTDATSTPLTLEALHKAIAAIYYDYHTTPIRRLPCLYCLAPLIPIEPDFRDNDLIECECGMRYTVELLRHADPGMWLIAVTETDDRIRLERVETDDGPRVVITTAGMEKWI